MRGFAARKMAPAGVERFVVTALLSGDHVLRQAMDNQHRLLRELLGSTAPTSAEFGIGVLRLLVSLATPVVADVVAVPVRVAVTGGIGGRP